LDDGIENTFVSVKRAMGG